MDKELSRWVDTCECSLERKLSFSQTNRHETIKQKLSRLINENGEKFIISQKNYPFSENILCIVSSSFSHAWYDNMLFTLHEFSFDEEVVEWLSY